MPAIRPRTTQYLWEFLLELLDGKDVCSAISWVNRERGEFVLKDQSKIATLWGKVKNRPQMDKIKLGRALRYYYKKKLLEKVPKRKAVYRFVNFPSSKTGGESTNKIDEIDFSEINTLDFLENTDSLDASSLSSFNDDDFNDISIEHLIPERTEHISLLPEVKDIYNELVSTCEAPMTCTSPGRSSTNNSSAIMTYCNNNYTDHNSVRYSNYEQQMTCNVPMSYYHRMETLPSPSNYYSSKVTNKSCTSQAGYVPYNNHRLSHHVPYNGNTNNYFTSLLVKSMLMSDNLGNQGHSEDYNNHLSYTIHTENKTFEKPLQINETSALNTLKEIERAVMSNSFYPNIN